ncbi:MAG: tetratricopeptide repeat protein [Bacteroidales bacterium]|nr:tetratricopeptide repeat protein [Bacteroidales bacterium]
MKKEILYFLFLFFPCFLSAENLQEDPRALKILLAASELRNSNLPPEEIIKKYDSLIQISVSYGFDSITAFLYNDQGLIFYTRGSYNSALDCFVRSLSYFEKINDLRGMGMIYNNLGVISFQAKNYSKSIEYFQKSLAIQIQLGNNQNIIDIINNIGSVHERLKNYKKAIFFHRLALKLARQESYKKSFYTSLNNLGVVYENTQHFDSALFYYHKAISFKDHISEYEYALSLNNLARVYLLINLPDSAKSYLDSAFSMSSRIGAYENLLETYRMYSMYYEKKNEIQRAFDYLKLFKDLILKLDSQKVEGKFENFLFQQNQKRFAKEKSLLENQIRLQRKVQIFFAFSTVLILIVLVFVIISIRQRNKLLEDQKKISVLENLRMKEEMENKERLAQLEKEKIMLELQHKDRQLAILAMQMTSKNDVLKQVESQLERIIEILPKGKHSLLQKIISFIRSNSNDQEMWENYVFHFEKVYPNFFMRLQKLYPHLNASEQRLCSYIFINLSNKEIAHILGISESSVKIRKNRLAKRLNLSSAANLSEILRDRLENS